MVTIMSRETHPRPLRTTTLLLHHPTAVHREEEPQSLPASEQALLRDARFAFSRLEALLTTTATTTTSTLLETYPLQVVHRPIQKKVGRLSRTILLRVIIKKTTLPPQLQRLLTTPPHRHRHHHNQRQQRALLLVATRNIHRDEILHEP